MTSDTPDGFALFLSRIARTPLLTPAEELRLARRVERGDLAAKERLAEANLRLVVHVAKRFQRDDHGLALPTWSRRARSACCARWRGSTTAAATASRPTR